MHSVKHIDHSSEVQEPLVLEYLEYLELPVLLSEYQEFLVQTSKFLVSPSEYITPVVPSEY